MCKNFQAWAGIDVLTSLVVSAKREQEETGADTSFAELLAIMGRHQVDAFKNPSHRRKYEHVVDHYKLAESEQEVKSNTDS